MPAILRLFKEFWPIAIIFSICIVIFAFDVFTRASGIPFSAPYMMFPGYVTEAWDHVLAGTFSKNDGRALFSLVTYAFLHGNFSHIFFNLLFIWIFGSLVLRELGTIWFFIAYFITAIAGGIGQTLLEPDSLIPTLGASGALMGLEGVYFGMALRWRLPKPDVWPIAEPIPQERLMIFAGFGVLVDISGLIGSTENIAYGAHLGGFIAGFFLSTVLIPRPKNAQ